MNIKKWLASAAVLSSPALLAHAGHDHSAWTAPLIHSVAAVSIAGGVYLVYKYLKAKQQVQQDK